VTDEGNFKKLMKNMKVPGEIEPFMRASVLVLPGEKEDEFLQLMEMMVLDIVPLTNIEWLCAIDLGSLWWEIQRYRRWKITIIMTNRAEALEEALCKSDPHYLLMGRKPGIEAQARLDAEKWRKDDNQRIQLNIRMKSHGYDANGINAEAFGRGLSSLIVIERFLASARSQVNALLREIGIRREFARRAREAFDKRLAESVPEKKQIAAE